MPNTPDNKWHLDKKVSLAHIFATISAISTLVVFGANLNTRLTLIEQTMAQAIEIQRQVDRKQDQEAQDLRKQVRDDLRQLNAKQDRIMEILLNKK